MTDALTGRFARTSRRLLSLALAFTLLAPTLATVQAHESEDDDEDSSYAIGLWGDLPYSALHASVGVPNLIADMNAQRLKFTVHDGDLKAGSNSSCDDNLYYQALGFFNALRAPAMFTPGDNDWTDCDRPSNGGFNSLERLDRERVILFGTPFSLGQRKLRQDVQYEALCLGFGGARQRII